MIRRSTHRPMADRRFATPSPLTVPVLVWGAVIGLGIVGPVARNCQAAWRILSAAGAGPAGASFLLVNGGHFVLIVIVAFLMSAVLVLTGLPVGRWIADERVHGRIRPADYLFGVGNFGMLLLGLALTGL